MPDTAARYARVKVENRDSAVIVPITSGTKPELPQNMQEKWQNVLDLIAQLLHVPSALIMKLEQDRIRVYASSRTKGNPYKKDESERLGLGLYCETVVGTRQSLLVPDALQEEFWKDNPDIKLGMVSYLGLPVAWDDGEVFGTFCVLDSKENKYSQLYIDLLHQFRDIVESDLAQLTLQEELRKQLDRTDLRIREAHHRIKNHFNVLISAVRLQSRQVADEDQYQALLQDIANRMKAVSLIHEKLYTSIDTSSISINEYLHALCGQVMQNLAATRIDLRMDADNIIVSGKLSLPLGLIITELVTNSIKHAFSRVEDPYVSISIQAESPGMMVIQYRDNGPGLPEGFDPATAKTFGMIILNSLAGQVDSTLTMLDEPGFACEMRVPVP